MKKFSAIIAAIFLCILTEANAMATEEPKFKLIEKSGDFELRLYDPVIVAETDVQGSLDEASNAGFRLIAGYIFGANKSRNSETSVKISMTAPVIVEASAQKIAMTAPVIVENKAGKWRVQFVMPSAYSIGTLPVPNDSRVSLREIPAQKIAAIVFSGFVGESKMQDKTAALLEWMKTKGLKPTATPQLARYNPPWTLPFFRRNEILVNYR